MEIKLSNKIASNNFKNSCEKESINKEILVLKFNAAIKQTISNSFYFRASNLSLNVNDNNKDNSNSNKSIFIHKENSFKISILEYINRLIKYSQIEISTVIYSFILVDRISSIIEVDDNNIYLILISALVVASKMNEDYVYKNDDYALIGGVSLKKLNKLEANFIDIIEYDIYVDSNTFLSYFCLFSKIRYN